MSLCDDRTNNLTKSIAKVPLVEFTRYKYYFHLICKMNSGYQLPRTMEVEIVHRLSKDLTFEKQIDRYMKSLSLFKKKKKKEEKEKLKKK